VGLVVPSEPQPFYDPVTIFVPEEKLSSSVLYPPFISVSFILSPRHRSLGLSWMGKKRVRVGL
jgi:hypothetical protein